MRLYLPLNGNRFALATKKARLLDTIFPILHKRFPQDAEYPEEGNSSSIDEYED